MLDKKKNDINEGVTSVFFASDYQFFKSLTPQLFGNPSISSCKPIMDYLAKRAYDDCHNVRLAVIGGDYTQNDGKRNPADPTDRHIFGENVKYHYGNDPTESIKEIKGSLDKYFQDIRYIFVQGNHDPDIGAVGSCELAKSGAYDMGEFFIYVLNDQDFVGPRPRVDYEKNAPYIIPGAIKKIDDPKETVKLEAERLKAFLAGLIDTADRRPIFICSHQPLHYSNANYNGNAHYIFDAISTAAAKLDIIFFFGHTHKECDDIGGSLSYIPKGGVIKLCDDTADSPYRQEALSFTYMNYGFISVYRGAENALSASTVDIAPTELIIRRYPVNRPTVEIRIPRKI